MKLNFPGLLGYVSRTQSRRLGPERTEFETGKLNEMYQQVHVDMVFLKGPSSKIPQ